MTAAAELPPEAEDLHDGLEAVELIGVFFGVLDPSEWQRLAANRHRQRGTGPGARSLTSLTALELAVSGGPADEASALAREALEGETLLRGDGGVFSAGAAQVLALGEPAEGLAAWKRVGDWAREHRSGLNIVGADLWGGLTFVWAGDLPAAEASLQRAIEGEILWGTTMAAEMGYSAGFLALTRLEAGDPVGARQALERTQADEGASDGARFWRISKTELLLAEGRFEEALATTIEIERTRPPGTHPIWSPWRTQRARALAGLGDREQALALAREELQLARAIGSDWVIGRELRILGELEGEDGLEHLREAVTLLSGTSARLEHAKALAALAAALTAAGRDDEARQPRADALALAERCGALGLGRELAAAQS